MPRMCTDSRRMWFGVLTFMMIFSVCASVSMMMYIRKEYKKAYMEEFDMPEPDLDNVEKKYSICMGVMTCIVSCSVCMLAGLLIMWTVSEWWVWPHQHRLNELWNNLEASHWHTHVTRSGAARHTRTSVNNITTNSHIR